MLTVVIRLGQIGDHPDQLTELSFARTQKGLPFVIRELVAADDRARLGTGSVHWTLPYEREFR